MQGLRGLTNKNLLKTIPPKYIFFKTVRMVRKKSTIIFMIIPDCPAHAWSSNLLRPCCIGFGQSQEWDPQTYFHLKFYILCHSKYCWSPNPPLWYLWYSLWYSVICNFIFYVIQSIVGLPIPPYYIYDIIYGMLKDL